MMWLRYALLMVVFLSLRGEALASFKELNPDGNKYEFARSYINALSYLKNIDTRWSKNSPKKKYASNDKLMIQASIEYLIKDNADLRIVKNYLIKYLTSSNALMRKASDVVVVACDKEIELNNREKILWEQWRQTQLIGQANAENERLFVNRQTDFGLRRKEIEKSMIEASILMTMAIKSADNHDEKGNKLALTRVQRKKLIDKIDSFAKEYIEWGLKPGQSPFMASIAVIREILEDPVWISIDVNK